jgi:hypothetical protein
MGFGEGFNELSEQPIMPTESVAPQEVTPEPIVPTAEIKEPIIEIPQGTTTEPIVPQKEFTEEDFLNYAKSKGKEVKSFDELFIEKEAVIQEKIVNPWEDVLDEEDKQYLTYKKETGRTRKDFDSLSTDYDSISSLELARERVRMESGQKLTNDQADAFLERKLGIDLSSADDLDAYDAIELSTFSKSIREQKKIEQQKYRQPIAPKEAGEMVTLDNGATMRKADYDTMIMNHQKHLEQAKAAVNSVTGAAFKVGIDDNGTTRELNYGYEYSQEDKHGMLSIVSDINGEMERTYHTDKGFKHEQFSEDAWWMKPTNREKAIVSIVNKARAEAIEELMKNENNVNFSRGSMQGGNEKVRYVPIGQPQNENGFGKYFK